MSDSGFGNIASPVRQAAQPGPGRGGSIVKIINLPESLQIIDKAVKVEGQISKLPQQDTYRIQTNQGNIDVQVKGNRPPVDGQFIEIDIPPGRPPRQASLNTSPPQTRDPQTSNSQTIHQPDVTIRAAGPNGDRPVIPPPERLTTLGTPTTPERIEGSQVRNQNAVPPTVQESANTKASNQAATVQDSARPLQINTTLRLIPVQPAQLQNLLAASLLDISAPIQNQLTQTAFSANLLAKNIALNLGQSLFQTPTPVQPTGATIQNIPQPNLINTSNISLLNLTANTPVNLTIPQPTGAPINTALATLTIAEGTPQVIPLEATANIATPQTATAPNAAQPQNNAAQLQFLGPQNIANIQIQPQSQIQLQPIDVQINQIAPADVILKAQNQATPQGNSFVQTVQPSANPLAVNTATATAALSQVIGFTPSNLPVLSLQWPGQSATQNFILQFNSSNLQTGSQIQIVPRNVGVSAPIIPTANLPTNLMQGLALPTSLQWPVIDEIYTTLLQSNSTAAVSLTRNLPNANTPNQITPAAMTFMAAIKSGDLSLWPGGNKADLLQKLGKDNLLSRLSQGSDTTVRMASADAPSAGDWRAVPLPMFWEGEIHKITLYTRKDQESNQEKQDKGGQTRFIFDLSLSRIGDIQIDGLLKDQRLSLIVRTQNSFSEPMQQTMKLAYSNALEGTEISGELNFQSHKKNWVHVLQEQEQLGVNV